MPRSLLLLLAALSAALSQLACASCPYEQRCNGNVLETCSLGVDQMVGDPSYFSEACEAPNAVCVQTGSRTAQCAMAADSTCSASQAGHCTSSALAVRCESGFEVATDCARDGNDCLLSGAKAQCAIAPATACERTTYRNSCEDDTHLVYCGEGLVARKDCAAEGPAKCEPNVPKDPYEQSAYCRTMTAASDAGVDGG